jgi:hypothetical protein
MVKSAVSRNGVAIRLTDERWAHISEEHNELSQLQSEVLAAIRDPVRVVEGNAGELLGVRELELGKYMVVMYREVPNDGFVITAFVTRRIRSLEKRKQLWP